MIFILQMIKTIISNFIKKFKDIIFFKGKFNPTRLKNPCPVTNVTLYFLLL